MKKEIINKRLKNIKLFNLVEITKKNLLFFGHKKSENQALEV